MLMADGSLHHLVNAAHALASPDVAPEKVKEANAIVRELYERLVTHGDSIDTPTLTTLSQLKMPVHDLVFSENYGEWVRSGYPTQQLAGYLARLAEELLARRNAGHGTAVHIYISVDSETWVFSTG